MTGEAECETVRRRVVYSGRVQGVCFRISAVELSAPQAVVGYVRNQPDGTVELEAEGPPAEVAAFLSSVETYFSNNITSAEQTALPTRGDETRFEIRY